MKKIITLIISVIVVSIVGVALYLYVTKPNYPAHTGGSGVSEPGTFTLRGYEVESSDSSKIKLGSFFSSNQQRNISTFLGALLFEKSPMAEYKGTVVPGSVDINYQTSVVQFKVKVQKPERTYTVSYNTLNDDMNVFDEAGQSLRPTVNPDGTPFKSFRTSSQLAQ